MAIPFGIEGSDSLVNGVGEVFAAGERLVCEMMPLQIAPYSLDGIELRGIFWQPFDAEPGRAGGQRGARRLAGVDGAVVEDKPDRLGSLAGFGTVAAVALFEKGDEISAAFARAGLDDQFPPRPIKGADHRDLGGLAGSGDTQIGALLGPDMGEVGMRECFRLVSKQQHDVAGRGLRFQQLTAQTGAVNGIRIPGLRPRGCTHLGVPDWVLLTAEASRRAQGYAAVHG